MASTIDGPRVAAKSRTTKQIVVFLHGYGSDGNDLIQIAKQWQPWMPDAAFVAPHAPEPCAQAPGGRQWFPLTMRDLEERWDGCIKAAPILNDFLDAELNRYNLDDSKLALVGFSQGAMLALHVGLRRAQAPGGIISYSGALVAPEHLDEAVARTPKGDWPPILLIHGNQDDLISAESLFVSAMELARAEIPCQWHLSVGVGHGIDAGGLKHGGLFLTKCFSLKIAPELRPRF
jgi:phospholipase/carboxylesterase